MKMYIYYLDCAATNPAYIRQADQKSRRVLNFDCQIDFFLINFPTQLVEIVERFFILKQCKYCQLFLESKFETQNLGDTYERYRPCYPDTLFLRIMRRVPEPFNRAVDLGGGTGLSTAFLVKYYKKVYAVEPDKQMADNLSKLNGNIEIHTCPAEHIDLMDNSVELITAGNSFYWMKGDAVIQKIGRLLRNNGFFAAYRYNFSTSVPEADRILSVENKKWDTFRHDRLRDEEYTIRTITNSNLFSDIRVEIIQNIVNLKTEELVCFFASTSYGSAYLMTIKEPEGYLFELEEKINKFIKDTVPVDFRLELIIAKK